MPLTVSMGDACDREPLGDGHEVLRSMTAEADAPRTNRYGYGGMRVAPFGWQRHRNVTARLLQGCLL
jgi:hypothetical protein